MLVHSEILEQALAWTATRAYFAAKRVGKAYRIGRGVRTGRRLRKGGGGVEALSGTREEHHAKRTARNSS